MKQLIAALVILFLSQCVGKKEPVVVFKKQPQCRMVKDSCDYYHYVTIWMDSTGRMDTTHAAIDTSLFMFTDKQTEK